jgi:hypothetical protein
MGANPAPGQWSEQKAAEWYDKQPWLFGFNFVPSTAANDTEMWQNETFDPATIDRELAWAEGLGYNSCRVFVQYIVWKADPAGFKQRFTKLLEIADKHQLRVMPVLFDDCAFGDPPQYDPYLGKQREPTPGMILPSWIYYVWQNGKISLMNDDMTALVGETKLLTPANAPQVGFEGAFIFKANGLYHLSCADVTDGRYHCYVASSKNLMGPYGNRYLAIPHGGHNMFFKDKEGQWWSSFFGWQGDPPFVERPAILRIEFGLDGEPRPMPIRD